jgi:hypothetical protein
MNAGKEAPAKKSLFRTIAEMDLFAPKADQNDYGARNKKNVSNISTVITSSHCSHITNLLVIVTDWNRQTWIQLLCSCRIDKGTI